jgi:hypothetical protein
MPAHVVVTEHTPSAVMVVYGVEKQKRTSATKQVSLYSVPDNQPSQSKPITLTQYIQSILRKKTKKNKKNV